MKPQKAVLTDFQWLLIDCDSNEIPPQEFNSEPLSLDYQRNQPETYPHQPQNLAA